MTRNERELGWAFARRVARDVADYAMLRWVRLCARVAGVTLEELIEMCDRR